MSDSGFTKSFRPFLKSIQTREGLTESDIPFRCKQTAPNRKKKEEQQREERDVETEEVPAWEKRRDRFLTPAVAAYLLLSNRRLLLSTVPNSEEALPFNSLGFSLSIFLKITDDDHQENFIEPKKESTKPNIANLLSQNPITIKFSPDIEFAKGEMDKNVYVPIALHQRTKMGH
ncbi:hypothetical protein OSB04_un000343 [Centaurea solstitialis]|uniref:Uncharacterized protein n=1 Tax=Centaurea solstitialis TaxID=347529 RepID=A0AA38SIB4_9ASTR|nr:hypothetical protein OSB04_un000343 [Centaurea solstitialis]